MTSTYEMDADWVAYRQNLERPTYEPPRGSIDTHCHVFGPSDRFPFSPDRIYTPCDVSKDDLFASADHLGIDRVIVVQASVHGYDNAIVIDALRAGNGRARGVVHLWPDIAEDELAAMHEAGVRGVRCTFFRRFGVPETDAYYQRVAERIAPYGWHSVMFGSPTDLKERRSLIESVPTPVVIDHMGNPDFTKPADGPEFSSFVELMSEIPECYVKIRYPPREVPSGRPDYSDVIPFAKRLIDTFPDRVIWGSDFPYPSLKGRSPSGTVLDIIPEIATSDLHRHKLLVENPSRLYFSDASTP